MRKGSDKQNFWARALKLSVLSLYSPPPSGPNQDFSATYLNNSKKDNALTVGVKISWKQPWKTFVFQTK